MGIVSEIVEHFLICKIASVRVSPGIMGLIYMAFSSTDIIIVLRAF